MAETIQNNELRKAQNKISRGENPELVLTHFARSLTNKLIHAPTTKLKQAGALEQADLLVKAREILGLNDEDVIKDLGKSNQENSDELEIDAPIPTTQTLQ